jgi:raffinose/stachyose/melibiose transport system substrate-binding protein
MKKNIFSIFGIFVVVLFMFSIIAMADETKPTITFAHNVAATDKNKEVYVEALNDYIKSVSDKFNVEQLVVNADDYKAQLAIKASANDLDDIMWFFGTPSDISEYVKQNLLLDVRDYFAASKINKYEEWSDDVWRMASYLGKGQYVIPTEGAAAVWVCNKALFEKAGVDYPKTFQDIIDSAPAFRQLGIIPLATGSKGGNPSHQHLAFLFMQYEGANEELAALSTTWDISSDNLTNALDLIAKMRDAGCFPSDTVTNGDWSANFALYNEGLAAVIPMYSWQMSAISEETLVNSVIIEIPKVDGGIVDTSTVQLVGNPAGLIISRKSFEDPKKKAAIIDFVDWYLSDEQQQLRYTTLCQVPLKNMEVNYDATEVSILADAVKFNKGRRGFLTHWYTIPNSKIWYDFQYGLDEIWSGNMTIEEFMTMIDSSCAANKE